MGRMVRTQNHSFTKRSTRSDVKVKRRHGSCLPTSLQRELGEEKFSKVESSEEDIGLQQCFWDIYEYEEETAPEELGKNKCFDIVDQLEYQLPSDFEDEEIAEDEEIEEGAAFGEEDSEHSEGDEENGRNSGKCQDRHRNKAAFSSIPQDGDEYEEEEYTEERLEDDEDGDEDSDERHRNMIEAVTGKCVKRPCDKRRLEKPLLSEAYPESEFNVNLSAVGVSHQISVDDLLTSLQGTTGFGSLRKRMQQLQKRGAPIHAPLPKVVQERLERKAGYERTSEDVTKWQHIVKKNREAPTLFFNKRSEPDAVSTAALASKFEPTTKLEKEISTLLQESGIADLDNEQIFKGLELNKFTVHEVKERQERLARMRNLLFQHEAKAKRIKKIKSKTFHRLLQKGRKKRFLNGLAGETDPEAAKEAALKQEFKRAQERMTLKHRNTSRWAKRILKRGLKAKEDGSRDAIAEQLRTHSLLKRKIHSTNLSSRDESSDEDTDPAGFETEENGLVLTSKPRSRHLAKAKIDTLKILEGNEEAEIPMTGLFSLPFMARAIEKKRKQANEEAQAVLEQLEQLEDADDNALEENPTSVDGPSKGIEKSLGSYTAAGKGRHNTEQYRLAVNQLATDVTSCDVEPPTTENLSTTSSNGAEVSAQLSNDKPWLFGIPEKQYRADRAVGVPTHDVDWSIEPIISNEKDVKQRVQCKFLRDTRLPVTIVGSVPKVEGSVARDTVREDQMNGNFPGHTELESAGHFEQENMHVLSESESEGEQRKDEYSTELSFHLLDGATSQAELIQRAFAGDDVEAAFEQLKENTLDEETPQTEGTVNLPGWGQWSDVQKKKGPPQWMLKEQEELKRKKDLALSERKDAKLKYVLISEKVDKKAEKFLSPSLPFPYNSREVFERSIRMPIGRDFNTDQAFRDMIRPSVVKDAGIIIDPIRYDMTETKREKEASMFATESKSGKRHRDAQRQNSDLARRTKFPKQLPM